MQGQPKRSECGAENDRLRRTGSFRGVRGAPGDSHVFGRVHSVQKMRKRCSLPSVPAGSNDGGHAVSARRVQVRRPSAARIVSVSAATASVALAVAACSPTGVGSESIDPPSTRVVSEGTSQLESDPAVQAARRGDVGTAFAQATGDFTLPAFVDAVDSSRRGDVLSGLRSQISFDAVRVPIGPAVWLPLEVREPDDAYRLSLGSGGVQIEGCFASGEWFATPDHQPKLDLTYARNVTYLLSRDGDELVLFDIIKGGQPCDATGAPVIEFDPPLAVPSPITEDSLVLPPEND